MSDPLSHATDVPSLLKAFAGLESGLEPWMLLHIPRPDEQVVLSRGTSMTIKRSLAEAISELEFPKNRGAGRQSRWGWTLMTALAAAGLAGVERTLFMAPTWTKHRLIGVVGLLASPGTHYDRPEANHLAWSLAQSLKRVSEMESLQSKYEGVLGLLAQSNRSLILVSRSGEIIAGTPSGWTLLKLGVYGERRPTSRDDRIALPDELRRALLQGIHGDLSLTERVKASVSRLPSAPHSTIDPLYSIALLDSQTAKVADVQDAFERLSPAEREAFAYVLTGLRNKEIASKLYISIHGVKHHIKAILRKLECQDRLELLARYVRPAAPASSAVLPVEPLGPVQSNFAFGDLHAAYMAHLERGKRKADKT